MATRVKKFGWVESLTVGLILSLILFLQTHFAIPILSDSTGIEPIIFWFLIAGLLMFLPMILYGLYILDKEGNRFNFVVLSERLRFKKMSKTDWKITVIAFLAIGFLSFAIMEIQKVIFVNVENQPQFMTFEPISDGRYYILLLWFPYWLLNIFGEEFFWRGVILPLQETASKKGWMLNSAAWFLFHLSFGFNLVLTLLPILIILPYVVSRQKNSWIGVILHAGLNGPSFLAISFGLI